MQSDTAIAFKGSARQRWIAAAWALALCCALPVHAQDGEGERRPVLRAAMLETDRIVFTNDEGRPDGFGVEVLRLALDDTPYRIEYVPCSRGDAIEMLRAGTLDIVFPFTMTQERAREFDFTESVFVSTWGTAYTLESNRVDSISELAGKRVATLESSVFANEFLKLSRDFQLGAEVIFYRDYDAIFEALESGAADAALAPNTASRSLKAHRLIVRSPIVFAPAPGRFMVAKGAHPDVLRQIDQWMKDQRADPASAYWKLQDEWFGAAESNIWIARAGYSIVAFAALAVVSVLFAIMLQRQVRLRTAELAAKNAALETEIHRREAMQGELREREELVNGIFENLIFVAFVKEPLGKYLIVNHEFLRYAGREQDEVIGKTDHEIFSEQFAASLEEVDRIAMEQGRAMLERPVKVRGEERYLLGIRFPLRAEDGTVRAICGLSIDITDQKRAERAVRESEQTLREVIDLVPHAIFTLDADERFQLANSRLGEILQLPMEQIVGHSAGEVLGSPARAEYFLRNNDLVLGGHEITGNEVLWHEPDGREFWFQVSKRRIRAFGSMEWSVLGVAVDVTELRQAKERLEEQQRQLEVLVDERTTELRSAQEELLRRERLALIGQLTATVSHELRNPMATIRGSVFMLEKSLRDRVPAMGAVFDRIVRNVERCDRIIDELLDFARARELSKESVDLASWVLSVLGEWEPPEGVTVVRELSPGITLHLDPERMRRCLQNLLSNACHAMKTVGDRPCKVTVRCRPAAGGATLEVEDTGEGITPEHLPRIFEPLYSTKSYGIGLGLPLVRQVAELHGGTVAVRSQPGVGTCFTVTLPTGVE